MKRWLVKVRRYTGGTSVLTDFTVQSFAQSYADEWNRVYQTDTAYVEENWNYSVTKPLSNGGLTSGR